eukprot:TRINITY_DN34090_c0_g1_i1.p1 TRINITY_DN34090_c0_g1~~TRINITY_DN34090_c0_g1_i1.p1  ORF type:complete len:1099 (-),score=191.01 TRINITY_DN34090_c0_g1_i1:450-3746(-)
MAPRATSAAVLEKYVVAGAARSVAKSKASASAARRRRRPESASLEAGGNELVVALSSATPTQKPASLLALPAPQPVSQAHAPGPELTLGLLRRLTYREARATLKLLRFGSDGVLVRIRLQHVVVAVARGTRDTLRRYRTVELWKETVREGQQRRRLQAESSVVPFPAETDADDDWGDSRTSSGGRRGLSVLVALRDLQSEVDRHMVKGRDDEATREGLERVSAMCLDARNVLGGICSRCNNQLSDLSELSEKIARQVTHAHAVIGRFKGEVKSILRCLHASRASASPRDISTSRPSPTTSATASTPGLSGRTRSAESEERPELLSHTFRGMVGLLGDLEQTLAEEPLKFVRQEEEAAASRRASKSKPSASALCSTPSQRDVSEAGVAAADGTVEERRSQGQPMATAKDDRRDVGLAGVVDASGWTNGGREVLVEIHEPPVVDLVLEAQAQTKGVKVEPLVAPVLTGLERSRRALELLAPKCSRKPTSIEENKENQPPPPPQAPPLSPSKSCSSALGGGYGSGGAPSPSGCVAKMEPLGDCDLSVVTEISTSQEEETVKEPQRPPWGANARNRVSAVGGLGRIQKETRLVTVARSRPMSARESKVASSGPSLRRPSACYMKSSCLYEFSSSESSLLAVAPAAAVVVAKDVTPTAVRSEISDAIALPVSSEGALCSARNVEEPTEPGSPPVFNGSLTCKNISQLRGLPCLELGVEIFEDEPEDPISPQTFDLGVESSSLNYSETHLSTLVDISMRPQGPLLRGWTPVEQVHPVHWKSDSPQCAKSNTVAASPSDGWASLGDDSWLSPRCDALLEQPSQRGDLQRTPQSASSAQLYTVAAMIEAQLSKNDHKSAEQPPQPFASQPPPPMPRDTNEAGKRQHDGFPLPWTSLTPKKAAPSPKHSNTPRAARAAGVGVAAAERTAVASTGTTTRVAAAGVAMSAPELATCATPTRKSRLAVATLSPFVEKPRIAPSPSMQESRKEAFVRRRQLVSLSPRPQPGRPVTAAPPVPTARASPRPGPRIPPPAAALPPQPLLGRQVTGLPPPPILASDASAVVGVKRPSGRRRPSVGGAFAPLQQQHQRVNQQSIRPASGGTVRNGA